MTHSSPDASGSGIARISGTTLQAGTAAGFLLRLDLPLSLWGGSDAHGHIIDRHHPQCGERLSGRTLAMPTSRGSSSSSSVLAELVRTRASPAAVLLTEPDAIVVLGTLVAAELYDTAVPVVLVSPADLASLPDRSSLLVEATGSRAMISWSLDGEPPASHPD